MPGSHFLNLLFPRGIAFGLLLAPHASTSASIPVSAFHRLLATPIIGIQCNEMQSLPTLRELYWWKRVTAAQFHSSAKI